MAYRFGPFRVDPSRDELWRGEERVSLNRKAVQLLVALIERRGELVTKEDLLKAVWPQRGATMNNVAQHIFMLRQALQDDAAEHRYVLTVPRTGYRFVGEVDRADAESPSRILAQHYCSNAAELWQMRTQPSIESAIALYNRAMEQDPECAQAYAGRARCRYLLGEFMFEPQHHMLRLAEMDARRAMQLDPQNATAACVAALASLHLRYAWEEAETLLLAGLRVAPEYLWTHVTLVSLYAMRGDLATARQALAHAESLGAVDDPFPRLPWMRGLLHYLSGAQTAAIAELELLAAHYPTYALARFTLAKALLANEEYDTARAQIEEILRLGFDPLRPGQPNVRERAMTVDVLIRGASGDVEGARAATEAFEREMEGRPVSGFSRATCALGCNDVPLAVRHLHAAIANRDPLVEFAVAEPVFAPLRAHPEWPAVLDALNLRDLKNH